MAWNYAWKVGPQGGTLSDADDYCTFFRETPHKTSGKKGSDIPGLYRHGDVAVAQKWHGPAMRMFEFQPRYTNASGAVTHGDGAAGHAFENFAVMAQLLGGGRELVSIRQTAPDWGTVQVNGWQTTDITPSQQRNVFLVTMRCPDPFWTATSQSNQSAASPITVAGNAPITDPIIQFTGTTTDAKLTHTASASYIQIDGALPAGGVQVDVGAGTCTRISGGTDYSNYLTVADEWWMELDPGSNSFTVSGGTITVYWYNKWR